MRFPSICTEQQGISELSANRRDAERIRGGDWLLSSGDDIQPALTFYDFAGNRVYQHSHQDVDPVAEALLRHQIAAQTMTYTKNI